MATPPGRRFLHRLSESFWLLVLSIVVMFLFFVLLGAFSPRQVAGLSIGVAALAAAWILHAWWLSRRRDPRLRDPDAVRARERRGF